MRFNGNNIAPETPPSFEPLPKGRYTVRILAAEEKDNSTRSGRYLKVELEVLGPSHAGRKLWSNMTTEHANAQAQSIGLGQVSAMARAIGRLTWDHESEIVGLIGDVSVGLEKDDPTRNRVLGWLAQDDTRGAGTYTAQHQKAAWSQSQKAPTVPSKVTQHKDLSAAQSRAQFDDDVPF